MVTIRWGLRLVRDIILQGIVNRSPLLALITLGFLVLGLLIVGVQVSAPFIYTLF